MLDHVKPIIQVNGTFLYGKYKCTLLVATLQDDNRNVVSIVFALVEGTLLVATLQDGNRNVVSIVFALVKWKIEQSWSWLLYNL